MMFGEKEVGEGKEQELMRNRIRLRKYFQELNYFQRLEEIGE